MNKKYYAIFTLLLAASVPVWAEDDNGDAEGEDSGKTIVVTATRTSQTVDETLAPVTVFTRADIEASQAKTIPELLQSVPGVQFTQSGSRGSATGMFIRGTNPNQSLVLIDGVRANTLNGTTDIQYLDLNQVERIEVVRGSRSSLYGADAIGGVIQIFTKKGSASQKIIPSVTFGYGSHDATETAASVGGTINNTQYSATASYEDTNGFDSRGGTSSNPIDNDDDAYRNASESLNVTQNFTDKTSLNLIYNHNEGAVQFDDPYNVVENTHQHFDVEKISSLLKTAVNDIWQMSFQAAQFQNDQAIRDSGPGEFDIRRHSANWQNDINVTDTQLLSLGVDYYNDHGETQSVYFFPFMGTQDDSMETTALFAQDQFSVGKNDLILGLRHEDNSDYGSHNTGDLSWGRNLSDTLRITSSYGKGFRAPTLTDLYYPGFSNPNLDPEKSNSYEIGLKGSPRAFHWETNVYQIDFEDMIVPGPLFTPQNLSSAQIQGLELAANTVVNQWRVGGNVTFLNPQDNSGKVLVRRSKRVLNVNVDRSVGLFDFGISWLAKSAAREYNDENMSGYGTIDIRGTYHATSELDVQLKVNNVLDKNYIVGTDPFFGYGDDYQDGTNAFLTVTYTPKMK